MGTENNKKMRPEVILFLFIIIIQNVTTFELYRKKVLVFLENLLSRKKIRRRKNTRGRKKSGKGIRGEMPRKERA